MTLQKTLLASVLALMASSAVQAASNCVAGQTYSNYSPSTPLDCGGATIGLKCDSDSDTQPAVLTLKNASIKNVVISATGGSDGIHCTTGTCELTNVTWLEVCEDAASIVGDNTTLTIKGGSAINTNSSDKLKGGKPDKFFQVNNANTTLNIGYETKPDGSKIPFTATIAPETKAAYKLTAAAGKVARTCGNCTTNTGPRNINISALVVKGSLLSVVGINSSYKDASNKVIAGRHDTAVIRNVQIQGYQKPATGSLESTPVVCETFVGVPKSLKIESPLNRQEWNKATDAKGSGYCDVGFDDITKTKI